MRVRLCMVAMAWVATACSGPSAGSGGGSGGGMAGGTGGGGTADAGSDAGCLNGGPVALSSNIIAYDLEELSSGYVIAASQQLADGGFGAVALLLDSNLQTLGTVPLPNGLAHSPQSIRATSFHGTAYIVFTESAPDAGVHLVQLALDGGTRELGVITSSPPLGPATVGANDAHVLVAFIATLNANNQPSEAVLYTFPFDGGAIWKRDLNATSDGGLDPSVDVYSAVVSPHGRAVVWSGYDNDAGVDLSFATQLVGAARTGSPLLDVSGVLEDTGPDVRAAWTESVNFTFFGITENFSNASYKSDLYSSAMGVAVRTVDDYTVIEHTNIGRGISGPALVWTEHDTQVVVAATTDEGAQAPTSFFLLEPDAGALTVGYPDVAFCGVGDRLAVTYLDTATSAGNLLGQLVCSP